MFVWLVPAFLSHAAELTLAWDPNQESDLAGYNVYWGAQSRNYEHRVDVGLDTTYTVSGLQDGGTYYFAVTACDGAGNESSYSQELAYIVPVVDVDNDGMADSWEILYFQCLDCDGTGDGDADGLCDSAEYDAGTDPTCRDSDADGMPDGWEVSCGLDPLINDAAGDADQDGFSNLREFRAGSLPDDASSIPAARPMPWLPLLLSD
jgi:hypothetical protein